MVARDMPDSNPHTQHHDGHLVWKSALRKKIHCAEMTDFIWFKEIVDIFYKQKTFPATNLKRQKQLCKIFRFREDICKNVCPHSH